MSRRGDTFWVPLAALDFSKGAPVEKLTIAGGAIHAGNAAADFQPAQPFNSPGHLWLRSMRSSPPRRRNGEARYSQ